MTAPAVLAGRFTQTSAPDAHLPAFDIEWISLGHASADEISGHIDTITFADLFEVEDAAEDGQSCPSSDFTLINCGDYGAQCLKVRACRCLNAHTHTAHASAHRDTRMLIDTHPHTHMHACRHIGLTYMCARVQAALAMHELQLHVCAG